MQQISEETLLYISLHYMVKNYYLVCCWPVEQTTQGEWLSEFVVELAFSKTYALPVISIYRSYL